MDILRCDYQREERMKGTESKRGWLDEGEKQVGQFEKGTNASKDTFATRKDAFEALYQLLSSCK